MATQKTPFEKAKAAFEGFKGPVHVYSGTGTCDWVTDTEIREGQVVVTARCGSPLDVKKEYAQGAPSDKDGPYHIIGVCRASADHTVERYGYWSQDEDARAKGLPPGAIDLPTIGA